MIVAPLRRPRDVLGYVRHDDGRLRVRRRGVRRLWQPRDVLPGLLERGLVTEEAVRSSVASWLGLAEHADAFQLSRSIFVRRDLFNLGKRLLVRQLAGASGPATSRRCGRVGLAAESEEGAVLARGRLSCRQNMPTIEA